MVKVGEQGIFLSDDTAKKISPYILSQLKKTLVLNLNSVQSFSETDPLFSAWLAIPPNVSTFTNDSGYLTSFSETDPIYTTSSWYSTTNNSSNWDTAFSWGNHASAGYLTSITSGQVTTALGYTPYNATNPSGYITSSSLSSYVPTARTLTINGTTYDLTADRSWTISTGTTYTFSTGLTNIAGTITSNLSTGISGGQSVVGGTASGNNLTLSSTLHATKGKILYGNSAYDEVNNRLGVGTTVPPTQMAIVNAGIASLQGGSFSDSTLQLRHNNENIGRATAIEFSFGNGNSSYVGSRIVGETASGGGGNLHFQTGSGSYGTYTTKMIVLKNGNVGIGQNTPTAYLHLKAGTATAGTAPIKLTSGTNLTTPENGTLEYDGTNLYFTTGGVRKTIQLI
jgi:hypothetical protein